MAKITVEFDPTSEHEVSAIARMFQNYANAEAGTNAEVDTSAEADANAEAEAAAEAAAKAEAEKKAKAKKAAEKKAEAEKKAQAEKEAAEAEAEQAAKEAEAEADALGLDDTSSGETEEVTYTRAEVKEALRSYAELESREAAIKLLKSNGANSIGELDESKFPAIMKAINS